MRIEKLLPPTPPAKTWTVALEGGKTLRVTESTVLDQGLFAGLELDEAALDTLRSAAASAAWAGAFSPPRLFFYVCWPSAGAIRSIAPAGTP